MHVLSKLPNLPSRYVPRNTHGFRIRKFSTKERLLYQNTTGAFRVRLLMVAGCSQLVFWVYLSYIIMKDLRKERSSKVGVRFSLPNSPEREDTQEATPKLRIAFSIVSLIIGIFFFDAAVFYSTRQISRISLLEGDTIIRVVTRNVFGGIKEIKRPINGVKSLYSLQQCPAQRTFITIKISNIWFHYAVAKNGHFPSKRRFDLFLHQPL